MLNHDELLVYNDKVKNKALDKIEKRNYKTISSAIKAVTKLYLKHFNFKHPREINEGFCEDFANDVAYVFGEEIKCIWGDEIKKIQLTLRNSHCLIEYKNRYYDAECPEGVDDFLKLPLYRRSKRWMRNAK